MARKMSKKEKRFAMGCAGVVLVPVALLALSVSVVMKLREDRGLEDVVRFVFWGILLCVGLGLLVFGGRQLLDATRKEWSGKKQGAGTKNGRKGRDRQEATAEFLVRMGKQIEEGFRQGVPLVQQHSVYQAFDMRAITCPACDTECTGGWIQTSNEDVQIRCPACFHSFYQIKLRRKRK